MTLQLPMEDVDDCGVQSGQDGQAAVEHDPIGGLLEVLAHESYGVAALPASEPDSAEHLRHMPLHRWLVDLRHSTQQQRHVGLEQQGLCAAGFLESVGGTHAHDLVVTIEHALDELVEVFGFGQYGLDHCVDVLQRSRVASAQQVMDRRRRIEGLGPVRAGRVLRAVGDHFNVCLGHGLARAASPS